MKKCPYCTETIKDEAVKCRYCGEWLNKTITVKTNEYVDGGHSSDITNKAKLNNEMPAQFSENNFQHTDAVKADIAFDDREKIIAEKQVIAETITDCFKEFKRQVLLVYVGFIIIIVIGYSFSEALAAYAFCGYIIIFFYYWTHLWSCARLIGKNPFLWISISGFLSFLGPAYAYQMLKKSAEDQGYISSYILKPNAESVWRGNPRWPLENPPPVAGSKSPRRQHGRCY